MNEETADIVNRVQRGDKEYITPGDAYLSTLACLGADLSMERQGLPITMEEVERGG